LFVAVFKLRHAIGGWVINREPPVGTAEERSSAVAVRAFLQAFETDRARHWIGDGRERSRKPGGQAMRSKARHIEEVLDEVLKFDKRSDDAVAGVLGSLHKQHRCLRVYFGRLHACN